KAAGAEKGSGEPNKKKVGRVTMKQVTDIAKHKLADLNTDSLESALKTVIGTARSMGVEVEGVAATMLSEEERAKNEEAAKQKAEEAANEASPA
ncbi:MAG: hypothetical protein AAB131_11625, partial [Actinomycetota bacterium]